MIMMHINKSQKQLKDARKRSSQAVKNDESVLATLAKIEKKARLAVEQESREWEENTDFKTGQVILDRIISCYYQ